MRRTLIIALGTAVALATAAVAIAVNSVAGVSETTATFTASTVVDQLKTRTCDADPSYAVTDGRYSGGTITFANPALMLDGPLKIHARTTLNKTTGLGYVEGSIRVKDDDSRLSGNFSGTLKGGNLVGFLTAKSHGNHAKVLGNMSAPFAPATGFGAGALGSTSSTGVLAVIAGPVCKGKGHDESGGPRSARGVSVKGEVTALTSGTPLTITVTPKQGGAKTCTIGGSSPSTTPFPVGTKNVEMKCEWIGTAPTAVLTLSKLKLHL